MTGGVCTAFTLAMRRNWDDAEAQVEGRPDAEAESVSIITMHLAKGLEWPIVIPINSPTELYDDTSFSAPAIGRHGAFQGP